MSGGQPNSTTQTPGIQLLIHQDRSLVSDNKEILAKKLTGLCRTQPKL